MSKIEEVLKSVDFFLYIQCNFSLYVCSQIFPELAEHLWEKWDGNLLHFITRLDRENRYKLIKWHLDKYQK